MREAQSLTDERMNFVLDGQSDLDERLDRPLAEEQVVRARLPCIAEEGRMQERRNGICPDLGRYSLRLLFVNTITFPLPLIEGFT